MKITRQAIAAFSFVLVLIPASEAKQHRSSAAIASFKRLNPCPANGNTRGKCPGWIIDHRKALCVGGEDKPENMQWQTVQTAKEKDRWECKPGWDERSK